MTGLHVVSKPRTGKLDKHYVYAWRGGPLIHTSEGPKPEINREILDAQYRARHAGRKNDNIDGLIAAYEASPQYLTKKKSTVKDYRLWLTRISERFGTTPLPAFTDWRMRGDVIEWRNGWASQPRTADKATVMMVTLLNWGVENGRLPSHSCQGISQLHNVNRADQVWEDRHWQAVEALKDFPPHVMRVLRLARLCGLRLGDLVILDWSQVGPQAIIVEKTGKRGGRAVIPIFDELRVFLDSLPDRTGPVLLNSRKQGWTASGLETVWQRRQPEGFDRTLHDLRGSFVTYLAKKGLTDEEIARIIGWTAKRIGEIRARYVDEAQTIVSLVERLSA